MTRKPYISVIMLAALVGAAPVFGLVQDHGFHRQSGSHSHIHSHAHDGAFHVHHHHHHPGEHKEEESGDHHEVTDHGDKEVTFFRAAPRKTVLDFPAVIPVMSVVSAACLGDWQPKCRAKPPPEASAHISFPHLLTTVILLV